MLPSQRRVDEPDAVRHWRIHTQLLSYILAHARCSPHAGATGAAAGPQRGRGRRRCGCARRLATSRAAAQPPRRHRCARFRCTARQPRHWERHHCHQRSRQRRARQCCRCWRHHLWQPQWQQTEGRQEGPQGPAATPAGVLQMFGSGGQPPTGSHVFSGHSAAACVIKHEDQRTCKSMQSSFVPPTCK